MLSLFVVNANLVPVLSWERQRQVTQAKALAQTHQGSGGRQFGVLFVPPFFLSAVCFFHLFYSKELELARLAWQEESLLPWVSSPSSFFRRLRHLPGLRVFAPGHRLPLWSPVPGQVTLGSSLSLGGLRSLKAASLRSCLPKMTRGSPPPTPLDYDGTVNPPRPSLASVLA